MAVFQLKLRLVVYIVWVCLDLDCIYTLLTLYLTTLTRLSLLSVTRRGISLAIHSDFEAKRTNVAFSSAYLDTIFSYLKCKIYARNYCNINRNIFCNISVMSVLYVIYYIQQILQRVLTTAAVAQLSIRRFLFHLPKVRCCNTAFSTLLCYKHLIFLVLVQKPLMAVFQLKLRLVL